VPSWLLVTGNGWSLQQSTLCRNVTRNVWFAGAAAPTVRVVDIASYCKLIEDLLELGTIRDNMGVFMHIEHNIVEVSAPAWA